MIEYEEIYDKEKIENDKYKSMKELSKYTKLLNKEGNLSFISKKNQQIKLRNPKSLFKISMLLGNLPEENVSFTFYAEEEDEQSEEKSSKKNIILSKKLTSSQNQKKTEDDTEFKLKNPKSIYFTDKIKDSVAQEIYKNGNIIGYDHSWFKKIWINLYKVTLFISSISLTAFSFYSMIVLKEQKYLILGADILSLLSLILMIITSISGNNKMKMKKRVNFTKENGMLITFIFMSLSCLGYWAYLYSNKSVGLYLYILLFAEIIFGLLSLMSSVLIYLNKKMIEFYQEYYKIAEEGTLLVEVQ